MAVKINFGEKLPTPEQQFLEALQGLLDAEHERAKAARIDHADNKAQGKSGFESFKEMQIKHGVYASMGAVRLLTELLGKMQALAIKHKPKF